MSKTRFSPFTILLIVLGLFLAVFPFVNDSRTMLILFTQIFIFSIFAMSYNLLLGYTGIVSFGHAMFFGLGAYAIGICMKKLEPGWNGVLLAVLITVALCAVLSFLVGILTLRLKSHFFAMLTLAVAGLLMVTAEKWRSLTMGNDGFTFRVPDLLKDRISLYFIALVFMVLTYLLMRRFTFSPVGKVLVAIRENEQRVESLGYRVLNYKIIANVVAGTIAGFSGILYAVSLRFVNTSVFATEVTLDALLMTIIGGVGTLFGPILGAALIEIAQHGLMDLAKVHWIFERWVILFGTIFILVVMFFPKGIVGSALQWQFKRKNSQKATLDKKERSKAATH
ncbi:branched-chain amino acid ABC transporter permease [Pseudalkalibacillus caeni]|uniref:Branched-chain amino acid ABC transporter permease n=1 Tax=Exobacillus caeni TaxID=2574798 RepID=A0A5R9F6X6_9BACL|nr:branched-chain amino acid ABC transporter permease [Pseudalkalibacillus caeni]TLS38269.1 branched-chain amino acid ABC transporter permease [Pseudalkalibacillus caeni]